MRPAAVSNSEFSNPAPVSAQQCVSSAINSMLPALFLRYPIQLEIQNSWMPDPVRHDMQKFCGLINSGMLYFPGITSEWLLKEPVPVMGATPFPKAQNF
jgi:hypothetical protein